VAIIGLSQSPGLLHELDGAPVEVMAVADFDIRHESIQDAQKRGIFVSQDYTEVLERSDLDLILNLIPDKTVEAIIHQLKPDRAQVIHASTASFLGAYCTETIVRSAMVDILADLARLLSGFLDTMGFAGRTLQRIQEVSGVSGAALWMRQEEGFLLLKGLNLPPSFQSLHPSESEPGPFQQLMEERAPLWIRDLTSLPAGELRRAWTDPGFRSVLLIPLLREYEMQGALALFHSEVASFSKDAVHRLQVLTELLGQVLQRGGALQGPRDNLIRDELTGLYNDVYFLDRLKAEFKRAARRETPLSLLYITLRPQHTMDYADQMMIRPYLRAIAVDLMSAIRNVDVPARYKMNDFVVILPDTDPSSALSIAKRLMERLSMARLEGIGERGVNLSIGSASYPEHAAQPKELLDNAELSSFLAGREGQNQIRVFPTGRMELNGLTPEAITRKYPVLSEIFSVLGAQGRRDRFSYDHAQEVARYAALVARELGLSQEHLTQIGIAGWLHDLGKMALPSSNGDPQRDFSRLPALNMKIHPTIGAYILKNLIRSPTILKAVLYHHANFDGTGQPGRVRGDSIPIEGRILAVANAYHHLIAGRGQTFSSPATDVFQNLRRKAGNELDPQLVECLIRGVSAG
jgi:diguanylate cyclase (GGDEF)-like protein/putative nucleotidyltransferase with HDIG domain